MGDATGQRVDMGEPAVAVSRTVALHRAHAADVYRYLSRLTAGDQARTEDLTQQVFERLASTLLATPDRVLTVGWLMATARTSFLHDVRHDRRERARLARVGSWPAVAATDDAAGVEHRDALRAVMRELPDDQRAALVFRYHDDLPVADVAALLGRSVDATESLLVRARQRALRRLSEVDHGS